MKKKKIKIKERRTIAVIKAAMVVTVKVKLGMLERDIDIIEENTKIYIF